MPRNSDSASTALQNDEAYTYPLPERLVSGISHGPVQANSVSIDCDTIFLAVIMYLQESFPALLPVAVANLGMLHHSPRLDHLFLEFKLTMDRMGDQEIRPAHSPFPGQLFAVFHELR